MGRCWMIQGAQPTLCDSPERWDGEGEREVQERSDMWVLMADSRYCVAETDTAL